MCVLLVFYPYETLCAVDCGCTVIFLVCCKNAACQTTMPLPYIPYICHYTVGSSMSIFVLDQTYYWLYTLVRKHPFVCCIYNIALMLDCHLWLRGTSDCGASKEATRNLAVVISLTFCFGCLLINHDVRYLYTLLLALA